ncbi:hypothetical protein MPSEU_000475400 [Mayamaea pseudoterrestris]|nr:hypothetical protein MPSEU_000475400 [Mayamaea pseudoterrestris]
MDGKAKLLPMASAMFFGTCLFATTAFTVKTLLAGSTKAIKFARNPRASPLDIRSFSSVYTILYHTSVLGLILFYAYVCENHPPFPHAPKSYNRDDFFFMTALLFLVAIFTVKEHKPEKAAAATGSSPDRSMHIIAPLDEATEMLNRNQTEEWKGWMQVMFLLYHYHHADEVYNAIRAMITCYVWMTGFGNLSFFYVTADYSLVRVLQMLWRLNFLVLCLCWTQGTTYVLYHICFLHTYYFLMVYVTMRIRSDLNYTKLGLQYKLTVLAVLIFIVWDWNKGSLFRFLHWPVTLLLGDKPLLGAKFGGMWEIYFRTSLDHWSTLLGMVFACNFPIVSLLFRKLEAEMVFRHVAGKSLMAFPLLGAFALWTLGPFQHNNVAYNQTNAFFAPIPLITYVFLRNLTPRLRSHSLELLHQIGKTTLETYLMQHHIWLTSDAKTLLTLIPGWPKINFLVVGVIYILMSRRLYRLTLFLRGMILPNDRDACLRHLASMFGALAAFYLLAAALNAAGVLNLFSVALVAISAGTLLYALVERLTWTTFADMTSGSVNGEGKPQVVRLRRHRKPILFGISTILAIGFIWQAMKTHGASKITLLTDSCASAVQDGSWIPGNVCEDSFRGRAHRNYGITSIGTCSPQSNVYTWGWNAVPSSSHCHFSQRDVSSLRDMLDKRRVTFVGDSIIRHLYHAMCRQLGDASAGSYNTSLGKWQDFSRVYQNTVLEFRWAPFTDLLSEVVDNITSSTSKDDAIVMGGGPWDRLHRYSNKTDQASLKENVNTLVRKLDSLLSAGIPIVWVTPTTINSWALGTEEKRSNIREDQIAELRQLYKDVGVETAATWVLHGPSFTKDRVAESYDGVHYPLYIYDGGAQILANAFDWLLPDRRVQDRKKVTSTVPNVGAMAHPMYGLSMLLCVIVALYTRDGFFGCSYIAGVVVPAVRPFVIFTDAYTNFHARMNISTPPVPSVTYSNQELDKSHSSDDFEMDSLIDNVNEQCN